MYGYLRMVKEGIPEEMTYGPGPGRGVSKLPHPGQKKVGLPCWEKREPVCMDRLSGRWGQRGEWEK